MPAKPGIAKKRVAQRRLHAVIKPTFREDPIGHLAARQRKTNPIAQWLRSLFTRILGRG
jgi:hypothetical protein